MAKIYPRSKKTKKEVEIETRKPEKRANGAYTAKPSEKLKHGLSSPIKIQYKKGTQTKFFYIFADADLDKNQTVITSVHTHEILGVVKTVVRHEILRAARWLVGIRAQMAELPDLFEQVNPDIFKVEMAKDHFNFKVQNSTSAPKQQSLISLIQPKGASSAYPDQEALDADLSENED